MSSTIGVMAAGEPCRCLTTAAARGRMLLILLLLLPAAPPAAAQPLKTWYLAEGATGPLFDMEVAIANPAATPATVELTFLRPDLPPVLHVIELPAASRQTIRVNDLPGLETTAVSVVVESSQEVVVERSMSWPRPFRRGGHNAPGVLSPATHWLLAEGATGFFDAFVLLANPSEQDAHVSVRYLLPAGAPIDQHFLVRPRSRFTIWPNAMVPGLANSAFSTVVRSTNDVPIIVERAMYWGSTGGAAPTWKGGHGSVGVTGAGEEWFFAEGFTGASPDGNVAYDTFILLANPDPLRTAQVELAFFKEVGEPVIRSYDLPPDSRTNVWVDLIAGLESAPFSARVRSVNGVPIVAERAMYWGPAHLPPGRVHLEPSVWIDGHNSPGLRAEATAWGFAEGAEDLIGGVPFDSYFLVVNPHATPLHLRGTFLREDGTGLVRTYTVPPRARFTIISGAYLPLSNQRFATFLESTNQQTFAAERAVYWGEGYYGGHGSVGTPWTGAVAAPPAPAPPTVTAVAPDTGTTEGGTLVSITGTSFGRDAAVTIGGIAATQVQVLSATQLTARTPPHTPGSRDIIVSSAGLSGALAGGYTYVPPAPLLPVTTARVTLAFGDSITFGTTSTLTSLGTIALPAPAVTTGYPSRLRGLLQARYPTQPIVVQNAGEPGERAIHGKDRLPGLLTPAHDLLILLQGVNDINTGGISQRDIQEAIRTMIRTGRTAGQQVIVSALTPVKPNQSSGLLPSDSARIEDLNRRLQIIAQEEGALFVDMHAAFGTDPSLLSPDGLHPSDAGYQRMAQVFYQAIVAHFEELVPAPTAQGM